MASRGDGEGPRNWYLLAGIRGAYRLRSAHASSAAEIEVLHTLDDRWGIAPPWGACDSGVDLERDGEEVLRAWVHVDLRVTNDSPRPSDVPVVALLRTMWDGLELFGTVALTGIDTIVPLESVGERLWERVAGSTLRRDEDRASDRPPRVLVQAARAWREPGEQMREWDSGAIAKALSEFVQVEDVMGAVPFASYPPSFIAQPFGFGIEDIHSCETDPFRAEVTLRAWSIDDAAWLAEAVCSSCRGSGVVDDVQIALRLVG